MRLVSDVGDSAVLLPLSVLLAVALWYYQSRSAAGAFLCSLLFCLTIIVLLKAVFISCGSAWDVGIVSPSGHASMGTAVFGAYGIIAGRQAPRWQQCIFLPGSAMLIAGVAASRVVLGEHTPAEVIVGVLVGAAALGIFSTLYFRRHVVRANVAVLVTCLVAVLVMMHGTHLHVEELIRHVALAARAGAGVCVGG